MKRKKILLLAGAMGLIAAAAAAFWFTLGSGGALGVTTAAAETRQLRDQYTEEGRLSLGDSYAVIPQVSGKVKSILVSENERVSEGQLLFTIDDTDYRYQADYAAATLAELRAQQERARISRVMTSSPQEYLQNLSQTLNSAKAAFEAAERSYNSAQTLYASGDLAQTALDEARVSYESAKSAYEEAQSRYQESARELQKLSADGIDGATLNDRFYDSEEAQLSAQITAQEAAVAQLQKAVSDCELRAERAGIVSSLPVRESSAVSAGTQAAVISGVDELVVESDVLSSIAPYIRAGSPVEVVLPLRGRDEIYPGTVHEVYDYAQEGTSALGLSEYRVHVKAELSDADELSETFSGLDGYGVDVRFTLFDENCLTVPSAAVFEEADHYYVYTIADGRAKKTEISVRYETGSFTAIDGGLTEGERVIAQVDNEDLYDGARVRE